MTASPMVLTKDNVAAYISQNASHINVFPPNASLIAEAIQGGNVNFSFCVKSNDGTAVFVKQAPEYVAVFGPNGFPLASTRINQEVAVYNEWNSILGEDDARCFLPRLYYFDDTNKLLVMEFLDQYELLDHHLVTTPSEMESSIASQLGLFLAKTHLATHSSRVSRDRAAYLTTNYENRALRDIQLEFVFTKAYKELSQTTSRKHMVDDAFLAEIQRLKERYNGTLGKENMSLLHGDFHPGSVMVKLSDRGEVNVRVIDPEFTIYGPPAVDVGSLLSGYILAAVHQSFATNDKQLRVTNVTVITNAVVAVWKAYQSVLVEGGISEELMREIEVESVGFALAEVYRTALGFAGIRLWLQFEEISVKEEAIQTAVSIVQKCMISRHEQGIQGLMDCLSHLSQ